jgi:gliding motility-associated-like protein
MKKFVLLALLVLFTTNIYSQLTAFSLNVTKTDETCLGNGSLTFQTTNLTPQSTLLYKVYRLPDLANPVAILATGNNLGSLTSGTYRVIAIQALGSASNTAQADVTIISNIVSFEFSVASQNQNCSTGGSIIVNTTRGTAASYEIISGPVTRPNQTSNVFNNLPSGTYNIRAFDICGMGKVKTFTLSVVKSTLAISGASLAPAAVCDSIKVSNTISATTGAIGYPLMVKHTLNPMSMGGQSIVIDQMIATGDPDAVEVSAIMPRYLTNTYTYDLKVTDNCNTVFEKTDIVVDPSISVTLTTGSAPCSAKFLSVSAAMHTAPYTIAFTSAPAGFSALDYNPNANNSFNEPVVAFGDEEHTVPFGNYVVTITDACGRTATESLLVEFVPPRPAATGSNNGCFSQFGRIRITVPQNKVVTATIIDAPAAYTLTQALPKVVTSNINSTGVLSLNNLPLGTYTIKYTDNCGNEYTTDVIVPPYVEKNFNITALPDCTAGYGTVRFRSGNGDLTAASIIAAPAAFTHQLPYNVTAVINDAGDLYMNNLPQGTYTFKGTDVCGVTKELNVNVEGYMAPQNSFTYTPNCASFSVKVTDNSNGMEGSAYWLQKYNAATNSWGHPSTGTVYAEGSNPATSNSIKLSNNAVRNNLNYSGKFRIVKKFEAFNNGTSENTVCVSVLGEFTYTDGLSISNAYSLACIGEPNTVYIETLGYPTAFRIIKKNGASFVVQNGANKIFHNLEPADYVFQVENACGDIITKSFSLRSMPSIAQASQPKDMVACSEAGTSAPQTGVFRLTDQNSSVLGSLPSAVYTITYHGSQADADNGVNQLPEYYTNISNGQKIYARLVHNEIPLCHGTTSFQVFMGTIAKPFITSEGTICNGNPVYLTANPGYSSYTWSNGEKTRVIAVTKPGLYTVTVTKAHGDQFCEAVAEMEIFNSSTPEIVRIETTDWTQSENTITVYAQGAGEFAYSIDGVNFQESNVFTGLECGKYKVYVKDAKGCGITDQDVLLLYYPNFFTPNGDGTHDKWQIKYSILEPHLKVSIFDRYGKHITSFGGTSEGWDGSLNGANLPSTDYWFVVTRADGREYKGHFAMLR